MVGQTTQIYFKIFSAQITFFFVESPINNSNFFFERGKKLNLKTIDIFILRQIKR